MIRLTGLWMNESRDGKKYMSGTMGGAKLLIFKNERKEQDKHPDYYAFIGESVKKQEGQSAQQGQLPVQEAYGKSEDNVPF